MRSQEQPERHYLAGIGLYGLFMLVWTIYMGWRAYQTEWGYNYDYFIYALWGATNFLVALTAFNIAWKRVKQSEEAESQEWQGTYPPLPWGKMTILSLGGTLGATTFLLPGLAFMMASWFFGGQWYEKAFAGLAEWGRSWTPWQPVAACFAGLVVMLASFVAVRSEEENHPLARRIFYGYNVALTSLLLLIVLFVLNVFVYAYQGGVSDWTASNLYTLSQRSIRLLQSIPAGAKVRVLIVMPPFDPLRSDLVALVTNYQRYAPDRLESVLISSQPADIAEIATLAQIQSRYPELVGSRGTVEGVVVEYTDTKGQTLHEVLKRFDLEEVRGGFGSQSEGRVFKGEQAITSALISLTEGKVTKVLYFTQDNGELDLEDSRESSVPDRGLGKLRFVLEREKYTVKPFSLAPDPTTGKPAEVPGDALALVVAGPTQPITDKRKLDALREYLRSERGRAMVLLEPRRDREGRVMATGLEDLLKEFGVLVSQEMVLSALSDNPAVSTVTVPREADRVIADGLGRFMIQLYEARVIRTDLSVKEYTVKPLLETMPLRPGSPETGQWSEQRIPGTPTEFVELLARERRQELEHKVRTGPLPVGVTVRKKTTTQPNDPHAFLREDEGAPKLVVLGDSTFISNFGMSTRAADGYFIMFENLVNWLRGRPELVSDIKPIDRKDYRMRLTRDQATALQWISLVLIIALAVSTGTGVYLSRRR